MNSQQLHLLDRLGRQPDGQAFQALLRERLAYEEEVLRKVDAPAVFRAQGRVSALKELLLDFEGAKDKIGR